ncbi:ATP-binding protein [Variovorax paradoxus]|uniref:ATP-binding protein n=1 Tax=Variovorax paradoxus TaxID=34073 RepID=UPI0024803ECE|nr:ATP-binding protein [Variovorax paradoxus]WGT63752.1 ATP-binding protein [Variovorax paradoxus]
MTGLLDKHLDSPLPRHVDSNHPLLQQQYAVHTPPIEDMAQTLGDWIARKKTGGSIHGPSRFGKSKGMQWHLLALLQQRFGRAIPLHMWSRIPEIQNSQTEFWKALLVATGHRYANDRHTCAARHTMFAEHLMSTAKACGSNFVALLIDEAQSMTLKEWNWILGMQNLLDFQQHRLSVYTVSSHQMGYHYELMSHSDHAHVAARFMVAHAPFSGLTCEEEIKFVLEGYDFASEWPKRSGVSYLAHFAPEAYARGERLARCAPTVWRVMNALLPQDYGGDPNFPMQHLALSVETILLNLAHGEDWEDVTGEEAWLEAFVDNAFTDHMRLISAELPRRRKAA